MSAGSGTDGTDTVQTVGNRLRRAGISDERIALHLANKVLQLDGQLVTDPNQPAPPGSRIIIAGS